MSAPRRSVRPLPESRGHQALRGLSYTAFLAAVGLGVLGAMWAGERIGFPPAVTGLITMGIMLYISLVLDRGPPDPYDEASEASALAPTNEESEEPVAAKVPTPGDPPSEQDPKDPPGVEGH